MLPHVERLLPERLHLRLPVPLKRVRADLRNLLDVLQLCSTDLQPQLASALMILAFLLVLLHPVLKPFSSPSPFPSQQMAGPRLFVSSPKLACVKVEDLFHDSGSLVSDKATRVPD